MPGREYADFKLVLERNIFDPNRRAKSRNPEPERPRPPEPRVDVVALTGTISSSRGTFAFFDGTTGEFRKTARVGETIAGYQLREIAQTQVALEADGGRIELKVGEQLRRVDEGAWEVTTGVRLNAASTSVRESSRRTSSASRGSSTSEQTSAAINRDFGPGDESRFLEQPPDGGRGDDENDEQFSDEADGSEEGPSEALRRLLEQRRREQSE
jgi:hypothetical protein